MLNLALLLPFLIGAKTLAPPRPAVASIRRFDQNAGQWPDDVRFVARTPRGLLMLGAADARLRLRGADGRFTAIGLRWDAGARTIDGVDRLPGVSNYLLGSDRDRWRRDVAGFRRVRYTEVAPRVDLEFYGATDGFEYDLVVRPGGDPSAFSIRIDGVSAVRASEDGGLTLDTPAGAVRQHAPVAYQERDGVRTRVDVRYELHGKRLAFRTGTYDRSRPLVIDPTIDFSTYVGGSGADAAAAVATDAAGNIYVTGSTASTDFPTASSIYSANAGGTDAFVMKLTPDGGSLVYATYLGGTANDAANAVAIGATGSIYVGGRTESFDFPVAAAAFGANAGGISGFVSRLSSDGSSLIFSTYLGGSREEAVEGLAIDGAGNAYVTGTTYSSDFPVLNAFRSTPGGSFVTKFTPGGGVAYSTYFGNAGAPVSTNRDADRVNLHAIAVDAGGAVYVGGDARSSSLPATPGAYRTTPGSGLCAAAIGRNPPIIACLDGAVAKLGADGSLVYATYLRGDETAAHLFTLDSVTGITVDGSGNAYVAGTTTSQFFPTTPGAIRNDCQCRAHHVFVTKLNPAGTGLVFSALLGGTRGLPAGTGIGLDALDGFGYPLPGGGPTPGIALDALGQVIVTGWTTATDLPVANAQQSKLASPDVFRITNNGSVVAPFYGPPGVAMGQIIGHADGTLYARTSSPVPFVGSNTLFGSHDGGATWTQLTLPQGGNIAGLAVDPNNSATLYTEVSKSTDGAVTWNVMGGVSPLGAASLSTAPLVRPGAPNVLYAPGRIGGSGPILKSSDGGATWTSSSSGLPLTFGGLYMSTADPDRMYYVTNDGALFGSTDGAATWSSRPMADATNFIATHPSQPLTVYAADNTGVSKSLDGGFTWTRTLIGAFGSIVPTTTAVYASTKSTSTSQIFVSLNGGDTWALVPGIQGYFLQADPTTPNTVFASTIRLLDGFVAALSPTGALVYGSYLGGRGIDKPNGLARTPDGGFVVVGSTTSNDFPTANAFQATHAGSGDAFVTKLRFPQVLMGIGTPVDHATAFMPFNIGGWALDRGSATDPGIDGVHVWAFSSTGAATFIGAVTPSVSRPDVAALYGPQFLTSGFNLTVGGLTPGTYIFAIYPHSRITNTFAPPQILTVTLAEGGLIAIGVPTNGATAYGGTNLGGWAIDRASTTDTGVNTVHVWAYPNPGSGQAPIFLGVADYGVARPDVGAIFGSRFTNSGFNLVLPPLTPGPYLLVAFPFSTVTNAFIAPATVTVTIGPSRPNGALNPPANNATVSGSFLVGGWAIDQSAPEGPGVDAVHVWAFPTNGGAATFLGAAQYGISRPDVGAIFGSQFTPSGYSLTAPALPPGTYDVYAFSRSTVSGTFNFASVARITVQ